MYNMTIPKYPDTHIDNYLVAETNINFYPVGYKYLKLVVFFKYSYSTVFELFHLYILPLVARHFHELLKYRGFLFTNRSQKL